MPDRRIRIEFKDNQGSKYTISLEGPMPKEKLSKIMDMVNELDGDSSNNITELTLNTAFNKTLKLIEDKFSLGSFTSNDLLEAYEDVYNAPTKLSTISTYLARLHERGYVTREQAGNTWVYKKTRITLAQ